MIICSNDAVKERLVQCFANAIKHDVLDQFLERLDYLSHRRDNDYAGQPPTVCTLGWDFANLSFTFRVVYHRKEPNGDWQDYSMHGGLVYHPGATGPDGSLSVELNPSDKPHWSVCT